MLFVEFLSHMGRKSHEENNLIQAVNWFGLIKTSKFDGMTLFVCVERSADLLEKIILP